MSITTINNKNIIQRKIFLPEVDITVLLIAIPKNCLLTDIYRSTKQLIYTTIQSTQQSLCEYSIFLVTEASIFDTKILLTLYEVLKYKIIYFIDCLLIDFYEKNVFQYNLITIQTSQRVHYQGFLKSNSNLACKEIFKYQLIQKLLIAICNALWYFYGTCITDMFLMLKCSNNSNIDSMNRNFCICNVEDTNCNIELYKFKILLVIQSKHIQRYYNFQSHLYQLLTHRRQHLQYESSETLHPLPCNNNFLYSPTIYQNFDCWKAVWNYYQIFFSNILLTSKSFPKQTTLTFKKSGKRRLDFLKYTVSEIRRKLKGTLYHNLTNRVNTLVSNQDVNSSNTTSNDNKSEYETMEVHKDLKKYWVKRYRLFSKFDDGIKLDYESWFSVTPEKIAIHIAAKCKSDIVIDAFCGAGGNTIQFANSCHQVMSIDIDLQKLQMARHNAKIYGVDNKIDFILGNFICLAESLIGDVVFLSPPWGGPKYVKKNVFDLKDIMEPYGGEKLLKTAQKISRNVAYYLPKNIDTSQLLHAAGSESRVEVEKNFLNDQVVAVTAYYGNLVDKTV
ncbi:uncharacterized protein LOC131675785 [Phymastichus coffea]|uniref:uncharacterized protein LOC131675785 n=1 Tax=Phymastichus coffea TaxID=108790 RepID=UPI00273CD48B|nr:uncharacterized protein LOC131675785 [Phymastichus coffea]